MTSDESILPVWFDPNVSPQQMRPLALAYVGDAVYDVFVRQYVLTLPSHRPQALHRLTSQYVSAKAQAQAARQLLPFLDDEEQMMFLRGRNAKGHAPPQGTSVIDYRLSTAIECLFGYLYYSRRMERLRQLMQMTMLRT